MASHVQLYLWSVERLSALALLFSLAEAKEEGKERKDDAKPSDRVCNDV